MDILNESGDLSSGSVSMSEVLNSPIPRISNMIKARLELDERKVTSLKESMNKDNQGK